MQSCWLLQRLLLPSAEAQAVLGEGDEAGDNEARTQGIFQQLLPMPSEAPAGAEPGEP